MVRVSCMKLDDDKCVKRPHMDGLHLRAQHSTRPGCVLTTHCVESSCTPSTASVSAVAGTGVALNSLFLQPSPQDQHVVPFQMYRTFKLFGFNGPYLRLQVRFNICKFCQCIFQSGVHALMKLTPTHTYALHPCTPTADL